MLYHSALSIIVLYVLKNVETEELDTLSGEGVPGAPSLGSADG